MHISITKTTKTRERVPSQQLGFGKYFSDHMFCMDYERNEWKNARIIPYGPFSMEPGASVLHYGQALFEGMKAFRGKNGKIRMFRPDFHANRMATGAKRLCMPMLKAEDFKEAIQALVKLDESWIPQERGCALYLRPTLIGTESFLGVRPSDKYSFFIITSPVGAYYAEGFGPVKIWVEKNYSRAASGGLGATKAAANYASSLLAAVEAKKRGFSQVLWLDAHEHNLIEEVGTMNVFFRFANEIVTPPLGGTILGGATRASVIQLLQEWKLPITERTLSLDEVKKAAKDGTLLEVFGTGTAAVISPVAELTNEELNIRINDGKVGEITNRLYEELTAIQYGEKPDTRNWIYEL